MSKEELEDVKKLIRATLISSQNSLTVNELCYLYRKTVEEEIPFRKFNFRSQYEFLRSIPDTVQLSDPSNSNSYVRPVSNEKTDHILKLVHEQKPPQTKNSGRYGEKHGPALHTRRFQRQRPILNNDFKKDVYKLLQNYTAGMSRDEFDSHVQRILANHYLSEYDSEEVLNNIFEFASYRNGKVFFKQNLNRGLIREHEGRHEDDTIAMILDSDRCIDEDIPSVSRSQLRCPTDRNEESDGYPFISVHLRDNLRALLTDSKYANGIWLTQLSRNYELKFGYPLKPKEYGFTDVMDMVANLKTIFHMKQYQAEGDYLLSDARRFSKTHEESKINGYIPKTVIQELKKMLQQGMIYTDDLLQEYRRTYQRELRPEKFGFRSLDSFLQHLENTCEDIVFSQIHDQTLMKFNCTPTDSVNAPCGSICKALPGGDTYDPFPPEVCNGDFRLETDPELTESKEGHIFDINFGEVYSPAKFYITHINRVKLLESMMNDLNEFYDAHEQEYEALPPIVSRNLLCACTYSKNSQWHRVRVLSSNLKYVKIFFIDYGTVEENVNIKKLRYLHKDFAKFPALCMQARLSGIQPKDDDSYSNSVCRKFYQLFGNINLEANVVHVTPDYLEVILYAQMDRSKVAVHEVLLKQGLVKRKTSKVSVSQIDEELSHLCVSNMSENSSPNEKKTLKEETKASSRNNMMTVNTDNDGASEAMQDCFSSQKVSHKPPPGAPFSQPPQTSQLPCSEYLNQRYQAQIQMDTHIPYSYYGPLYSPSYSCYGDPSIMSGIFTGTMYPTYPMYYMPQYLDMSASHGQYFKAAGSPSSFRSPPGIQLPPMWQDIPKNYPSLLKLPNDVVEDLYSKNLTNPPPAKSSSSLSPTNYKNTPASYYEICQSVSLNEGHDSCCCSKSYPTKNVSSELTEMNSEMMKKMFKKFFTEQINKVNHNPNTRSVEKAGELAVSVSVLQDEKSLCEKQAAKEKLKAHLRAEEYNEYEEDAVETTPLALFQTSVNASEFISKKAKTKIRASLTDSEVPPIVEALTIKEICEDEKRNTGNILHDSELPFCTALMPNRKLVRDEWKSKNLSSDLEACSVPAKTQIKEIGNEKLNPIRAFVMQQVKSKTS